MQLSYSSKYVDTSGLSHVSSHNFYPLPTAYCLLLLLRLSDAAALLSFQRKEWIYQRLATYSLGHSKTRTAMQKSQRIHCWWVVVVIQLNVPDFSAPSVVHTH